MKKLFSKSSGIALSLAAVAGLLLTGCDKEETALLPGDAGVITQTTQEDGSILLSIDEIANAETYRWYMGKDEVQNTESRTYMATESGEYTVAGVNANGEGKASPVCEVEISEPEPDSELPADAGEISQEEQEDGSILLSVEEIEGAETYRWYKDDEEVQNTEERTYLAQESGVYKVAGVNDVGEGKASPSVTVEIGDVFNILTEEIIEDEELRNWISQNLAGGSDTYTNRQAAAYTGEIILPANVSSLKGLEYFTSFTVLTASGCRYLPSPLDLSPYPSLKVVNGKYLNIEELNLDGLTELLRLSLEQCQYITSLDLLSQTKLEAINLSSSGIVDVDFTPVLGTLKTLRWSGAANPVFDLKAFTVIDTVDVSMNAIGTLDVSGMSTLRHLTCSTCSLTDINLSGCSSLDYLLASYNSLTSIDVSECTSLRYLMLQRNDPSFSQIDLSSCRSSLVELNLGYLGFTEFDASGMSNLEYLALSSCPMTGASLDLNDCVALQEFRVEDCYLSELKIEKCTNLVQFWCYNNKIASIELAPSMPELQMAYFGQSEELSGSLDFGDCPKLENIQLYYCSNLNDIDITGCPVLVDAYLYGVGIERLDVSNNREIGWLDLTDAPNIKQIKVWPEFDMNNLPSWAQWLPDGVELVYEFD